jgi:DNA-binding XRE family transcriptional regulator
MTKGKNLQEIWDSLPADRRQRIEKRTQELEAEYLALQEMRQLVGITQSEVAQKLGIPQSNVSRLEKSSDMLISTLRGYVEALGGKLEIAIELPDRPSVKLHNLGDLVDRTNPQS